MVLSVGSRDPTGLEGGYRYVTLRGIIMGPNGSDLQVCDSVYKWKQKEPYGFENWGGTKHLWVDLYFLILRSFNFTKFENHCIR